MAHKDWLPGGRDDVLHLAKTWLSVLPGKAALWNIPAPDSAELTSYTDSADTILQKAKSGKRTEAVSAECRAAFDLLRGKLRYIKDRYLKRPPLTDADFPTLLLKPPDTHPTPAPVPSGEGGIPRSGMAIKNASRSCLLLAERSCHVLSGDQERFAFLSCAAGSSSIC
jgi:hypothetical protein